MDNVCLPSYLFIMYSNEGRYVHGGAWRDPAIASLSFEPAMKALWESPMGYRIEGFASLNYRLSPYPAHPEDPSSPEDSSRNVQYPDHLLDVEKGLLYLDKHYHISSRYVLVGHSAGATMAFELHNAMLPVPAVVLGIAGIYDIEAFVENHSEMPAYREIIESAFGKDRSVWERASPYKNRLPDHAVWEGARAIIITHSDQDEMVEEAQSSSFYISLTDKFKARVHFLKASGNHDEIWQNGKILARLVTQSIETWCNIKGDYR